MQLVPLTADERPLIPILLLVTTSTGVIDAICVLHLGVFAAYMTGTIILVGLQFVGAGQTAPGGGLIALACFALGAVLGGRLARRAKPRNRLLAESLIVVSVLVFLASLVMAFGSGADAMTRYAAIVLLATGMGIQVAATRHRAIPDMTMPAATMVIHGLAYDSPVAGGQAERYLRRFGVIIALMAGAASGALIATWHVWAGLLLGAALIAAAGILVLKLVPVTAEAIGR
jgi:uncharacterized membrane protein YoaK (UPF0700 family)